jgi:hypothetical protein
MLTIGVHAVKNPKSQQHRMKKENLKKKSKHTSTFNPVLKCVLIVAREIKPQVSTM